MFSFELVNGWLADTSLTDLQINFREGTYTVAPASPSPITSLTIRGDLTRSITLKGDPAATSKPRLMLGSVQGNPNLAGYWTDNVLHHWLIASGTDEAGKYSYVKRIVIENLDLDGNFANQGAWASEANATGYKSFAIDVAAESGWIKNVVVRNFGSVGDVPASHLHQGGGVEAFPVRFRTFYVSNQALNGAAPNDYPWIVEDLEVTDFHSIHGGYGTMIMPVVYQNVPRGTVTDPPVAVIRRCQLRLTDGAIAFGTAGADGNPFPNVANLTGVISGRIRFQDNVVLGAGIGFNTDTYSIGPLVFENNAFLDIGFLGFVGQADSGDNHIGYKIKDNLIRLRGRFNQKTWSDISLANYPSHATDANLPLGRYIPDEIFCAGLAVQGAAAQIEIRDNDFTTWPQDNFFLNNPSVIAKAKFWIVWKMPSLQNINSWLYARNRPPVHTMDLYGTRLSGTSYDFNLFTTLASGTDANFDVGSTHSYSVQHMEHRDASAVLPTNFIPRGRLRRVLPQWTMASPSRLKGVQEIQIGEVTYGMGTATVSARIVEHLLRSSGQSPIETQGVAGKILRFQYQRSSYAWNPTTGAWETTTTTTPVPAKLSPANGLVSFTLAGLSSSPGLLRFTVWVDAGTGGSNGTFDPDQDGWATYDYPLDPDLNRPVVELTASPDVGDDKNTASVKRATLRVTRSHFSPSSPSLDVRLSLPVGVYLKPGSSSDLTATYGTSGTADYYLTGSSWAYDSASKTATITIPAGQGEATAQVVTRADQLTEQNVIVCRLLPPGLTPGPAYSPGASTSVNILIFDGPYWTVQELAGPAGVNLYSSSGLAVNSGVFNTAGTWTTPPQIVGAGTWANSYGQAETHGALWATSLSSQTPPATDFGLIFRPYGISFRPSTVAADRAKVVGSWGSSAYQILDNNTGGTTLPHFASSTGPSLAWAISPDGTRTVGYSTSSGKTRPALWTGTGTPIDLSSGLEDPMNQRIGEAKAVNNSGVVVGYSSGFLGGASILRPFSNDGFGSPLSDDDYLTAPNNWTQGDGSGVANAVSLKGGASVAGGRMYNSLLSPKLAVCWYPDGSGIPTLPSSLSALKRVNVIDLQSEVLGINSSSLMVGWSGANSSDPDRRAVFHTGSVWKDLNDRHFIHGPGWVLQSANAVSDNETVVGAGTLSGSPRGYILIPRVDGQ
ncbi:MAG: hypothetical protein J0M24_22430 [Verrucomicrobia bacterium]|nr:hypothetical protein [Verrucomicrobiota bacterium]